MIHRIFDEWRKVFVLSATFLLAVFLLFSCKKTFTEVGKSGIDAAGLLAAGAIDTFTLETYTVLNDSVVTKNPLANVLGEINDPVFGKTKASFYTQLRLNSVNPNFGDLAEIKMDSVVLAMQFSNYTGDFSAQNIEVYELDEAILSDTAVRYYEFSSLPTKANNLVDPNFALIKPEPIANAIVDTVSVAPQMRVRLDTNFAKTMILEANNNASSFASNENFLAYFKGLYITTNNAPQPVGKGGLFGFSMSSSASKVTLYYHKLELVASVPTWVKKSYDFVISSASQSFNRMEFDRTGSKVEAALNDKSKGLTEFYSQTVGVGAVVHIPGLSNLPKTAIVHKAILDLPIQFQTGSKYATGSTVQLWQKPSDESNSQRFWYTTNVSDFTKSVSQDITTYAQSVISGLNENKPLYVYPTRRTSSGDRIIFNGSQTQNKMKPKLYIIYTVF